jgi:phospholipid transport system substrate-binding protein
VVPASVAVHPAGTPAPEADASAVVESFHEVLIEVMKASDSVPFEARKQQVAEALDRAFDMPFMARASVGKVWKALDEDRQREWVELSRQYSAANYAKNFKGWTGQQFQTHGVEPAARDTLLVKTELVQPAEDNARFDYRLRKVDEDWRIIDIQIDGKVSEITLRRADYRSVVERDGFDQLFADVSRKVDEMSRN